MGTIGIIPYYTTYHIILFLLSRYLHTSWVKRNSKMVFQFYPVICQAQGSSLSHKIAVQYSCQWLNEPLTPIEGQYFRITEWTLSHLFAAILSLLIESELWLVRLRVWLNHRTRTFNKLIPKPLKLNSPCATANTEQNADHKN